MALKNKLTNGLKFVTLAGTMSQDLLIKMVSVGDKNGLGKGHTYYTRYNNKSKKDPTKKYEAKKYNPVAKKHTVYKQKK